VDWEDGGIGRHKYRVVLVVLFSEERKGTDWNESEQKDGDSEELSALVLTV
jgi:hypothetical protein